MEPQSSATAAATEPGVAVVASLNADHVVTAPRIPAPGETILGTASSRALGGKGGNQAVAAARLGARVAVIGCVGDDADGQAYLQALASEGVDLTRVARSPAAPTGMAAITVAADGANSIVVVPGANAEIPDGEAAAGIAAMSGLRVVLGQLEANPEATVAAFQAARERGVLTILNPAPANEHAESLLPLADIVVPNEVEFGQLSGESAFDESGLRRGANKLLAQGAHWVIVTLGEQGSVVVGAATGSRSNAAAGATSADCVLERVPAVATTAVDTTAAGDSYVGTLAAQLAELGGEATRDNVMAACERAAHAAACTVAKSGAQPSLPYPKDLTVATSRH